MSGESVIVCRNEDPLSPRQCRLLNRGQQLSNPSQVCNGARAPHRVVCVCDAGGGSGQGLGTTQGVGMRKSNMSARGPAGPKASTTPFLREICWGARTVEACNTGSSAK